MPLKHSVSEIELKNGAKGLIIDVPDSSVFNYDFSFRAGNGYVKNPKIHQTAHLLEHLAFNGTKKYPSPEQFSQVFTENGAYNNAATYEIEVSYYGGSADFEAERILGLQGQALAEPVFSKASLEKEKNTVSEELTGQLSNHFRYLWNTIMKEMGSRAFTDEEKMKTINNTTIEDIWEHYNRTHTTKNMRFILGGNLSGARLDKMIKQIENWQLPKGEAFDVEQYGLKKASGPIMLKKDQVQSVYFNLIMMINRRMNLREMYAMRALNHTLTSTFHSRIFGKARKQGLSYGVHSLSGRYADGVSEFQFVSQVTPANAQKLYDLIIQELNNIAKNGITQQELESVKRFSYGQYQLYGQTVSALTGHYNGFFQGDKTVLLSDVEAIINSITIKEIKDLTNEFLSSGIWGFGELGAVNKKSNEKAYDAFATKLFERG